MVDIIDKAIFEHNKIYIWYTAVGEDEVMRLVTPLAWQAKNGFMYVTSINGWGEIRTYRLDRISKVKEAFKPGKSHDVYDNMYDFIDDN